MRHFVLVAAIFGCVPEGPANTRDAPGQGVGPVASDVPFEDRFERAELGQDYLALSPGWAIQEGQLCGEAAKNRGVWLNRPLPEAVRVEFDAVAQTEQGDIKIEIFGDGVSGATADSYTHASGYVAIFGGWQNTLHVFARHNEHGRDRMERALSSGSEDPIGQPVTAGRRYHFKFERKQGNIVHWSVDEHTLFSYVDSQPLVGPKYRFFGFNNWAARVCFDNLTVTPL